MLKNIGFIALLFKLGPLLLKFIKSAKFIKVALAGGSMMAYSYLFTWEFAIILLMAIVFHEYGHITAMKKCGIPTKGIYLIPFLGGAAVADEDFKTRAQESYVALWGPLYGLILCIPFLIYGIVFESPLAMGLVSFMALLNLFNLFPINPLDGGRLTKSIAFSLHSTIGFMVVIAGFLLALGLVYIFEIWLLVFIVFIGGLELFFEWKSYKNVSNNFETIDVFKAFVSDEQRLTLISIEKARTIHNSEDVPEEIVQNCRLDYINMAEQGIIPQELEEILDIEKQNLIQHYKENQIKREMSKEELKGYGLFYVILVVAFVGLIWLTGQYEGSDLALKLLKEDIS